MNNLGTNTCNKTFLKGIRSANISSDVRSIGTVGNNFINVFLYRFSNLQACLLLIIKLFVDNDGSLAEVKHWFEIGFFHFIKECGYIANFFSSRVWK